MWGANRDDDPALPLAPASIQVIATFTDNLVDRYGVGATGGLVDDAVSRRRQTENLEGDPGHHREKHHHQTLEMWEVFSDIYVPGETAARMISSEVTTGGSRTTVVAQLLVDRSHTTVEGQGNSLIDAFLSGLRSELGVDFAVRDHALTLGGGASAVAYVEAEAPDGRIWWAVGMASSIFDAWIHAVVRPSRADRRAPIYGAWQPFRVKPR
jgi:hypothetical protein